jgi:RNA polymerase-binding transcription factor DksA
LHRWRNRHSLSQQEIRRCRRRGRRTAISKETRAMTSVAERKAVLEARRKALTARIAGIGAEFDTHEARDWEEMATERESDEVLEDLGLSAQHEIRMIDAALQRVEDGEYGFCVTCGSEIDDARLDVLPATPFCKNCAPQH